MTRHVFHDRLPTLEASNVLSSDAIEESACSNTRKVRRRYIVWADTAKKSLRIFREAREKICWFLMESSVGRLAPEDDLIIKDFLKEADEGANLIDFSYMAIYYAERLEESVRSREKLELHIANYRRQNSDILTVECVALNVVCQCHGDHPAVPQIHSMRIARESDLPMSGE